MFAKFISENLVYPADALKNKIEGTVFLLVEIDDNGNVLRVKVENGVGHGCDEEAVRLVKQVKYSKVKNRGVRLKAWKRLRINFKLPKQETPQQQANPVSFNYVYKEDKKGNGEQKRKYNYSVPLSNRK